VTTRPPVSAAIALTGAMRRTREKSNGEAIVDTETTGRSSAATASSDMIPPRHQPTSWIGAPPLSSWTAATARGITSSTQCSSPSSRSENEIGP